MGILSWLDSFFTNAASSIGSAVSSAVHWALRGITSIILGVFRTVTGAWNTLYGDTKYYLSQTQHFIDAVYNALVYTLTVRIPHLISWAGAELAKLARAIYGLGRQLVRDVASLLSKIAAAVRDITRWVQRDIWAPLYAFFKQTYNDLLKWGYYAYWLLTHLPVLADALIMHLVTSLEKYAWQIAGMLGEFFLALIVKNLRRVALLIEDIVTAVL